MEDENEFCCDFHLRSTSVKDYDGWYIKYYCPICYKEWSEKVEDYEDP